MVNQNAGIAIGASVSLPSPYCLSITALTKITRFVMVIKMKANLLNPRIVTSVGSYDVKSITASISAIIAPSETNLSPLIPSPNNRSAIGAAHRTKFNLCFIALWNTNRYIGTNSNPPLVSNSPRISNPIKVVMSALRLNESSLRPLLSNIIEIPRGPASNSKSKKIIELYNSPISLLAALRLKAIGAATAIIVRVAIILPVEDASSSLTTSATIIPIGTTINRVQTIFSAKSFRPTAVNETVNRIIGPIRLIRPRGPQE